jgi:hypothetical protein
LLFLLDFVLPLPVYLFILDKRVDGLQVKILFQLHKLIKGSQLRGHFDSSLKVCLHESIEISLKLFIDILKLLLFIEDGFYTLFSERSLRLSNLLLTFDGRTALLRKVLILLDLLPIKSPLNNVLILLLKDFVIYLLCMFVVVKVDFLFFFLNEGHNVKLYIFQVLFGYQSGLVSIAWAA